MYSLIKMKAVIVLFISLSSHYICSLISDLLYFQEEIKSLKKTVEELNESNKTLLLSSSGASASERSHYSHFNQPHSNGMFVEQASNM